MTTPDDVLAAVRSKQQRDEAQVADLVRRGTNLPAARSFADGGMHPTFASAVRSHNVDDDGVVRTPVSTSAGTIPANIRTPPSGERVQASRATPEDRDRQRHRAGGPGNPHRGGAAVLGRRHVRQPVLVERAAAVSASVIAAAA